MVISVRIQTVKTAIFHGKGITSSRKKLVDSRNRNKITL
jgi:hypothetical protein